MILAFRGRRPRRLRRRLHENFVLHRRRKCTAEATSVHDENSNRRKDPLLTSLKLKTKTLKNRIVSTSHAPNYVEKVRSASSDTARLVSVPGKRYRAYHAEKAKGGLAMTMIGGSTTVSLDSPSAFGQIDASDDAVIPYFQQLADAVHLRGALTMCQLTHLGRRTTWDVGDWLTPISPSRTRESAHRAFTREMENPSDFDRVAADFASAARRCEMGGLDGVEIFAAGHLLDSFWSSLTNARTDEYGALRKEDRVRFTLKILDAVREAVSDDFVVGVRMFASTRAGTSANDADDLTDERCLEVADLLTASGLVDFFNINVGAVDSDLRLSDAIPGMSGPLSPFLEAAKSFKTFGLPVIHACRVNDLATARSAVSEEYVDLIGMTRAHLADPHLVRKLVSNEEHRIRPCVGAGYCLDRIYVGKDALCLHNAATGREYEGMTHVFDEAETKKKVVVVGGGVGGLEAARVCAEAGHRVVLMEASSHLGGQIRLASQVEWRRDLSVVVDWLTSEVEVELDVDVRYQCFATARDVLEERPDVVIVATGGVPDTLEFDETLVVSSWQVLSGETSLPPGGKTLVYDGTGTYVGPSCAEFVATVADPAGTVELVTPDRRICEEMGALNWPVFLRNLYRAGNVTITPDTSLRAVEALAITETEDGTTVAGVRAILCNDFSNDFVERKVDTVVVEHGTVPNDALYTALRSISQSDGDSAPFDVYRVGDAVSSRNVHAAIYDAMRVCKEFV